MEDKIMKLIAYSSSSSNGMNGSRSAVDIAYAEDGRCKVDSVDKLFHSQPTIRESYYVRGLLEKLSEVCERYGVINWTDLPDLNIRMCDGSTGKECFTFEDGTKIFLESGKRYPELAGEMFHEIRQIISDYREQGEDLKTTQEDSLPFMGMMAAGMNGMGQPVVSPKVDVTGWAKFCVNCGAQFTGNQKFCAECGSVRQEK